jgi:DnaJ-class molecular chaperone
VGKEEEIQSALDRLDLPLLVTKNDIKKRYRQLVKRYHPDVCLESSKTMESINQAYALLMEYIEAFRYTFDADEIARQYPGASHAEKFKP